DVMAAPESGTGDWWFWFGWAERIAPVGVPDTAAAVIVAELRRPVDVFGGRAPGGRGGRPRVGRISLSAISGQKNQVASHHEVPGAAAAVWHAAVQAWWRRRS